MPRRRQRAMIVVLAALPSCAALSSWDGFSGGTKAPTGSDGGGDAGLVMVQSGGTGLDGQNVVEATATFTSAQRAGDLNIVAIGWYGDGPEIKALPDGVTDTSGNVYRLAIGRTPFRSSEDQISQSIYYASGIKEAAPGANVVRIAFDTAVDSPDVRIVEFAGLDPVDPLDQKAASAGYAHVAKTGPVKTQHARELLFAAVTSTGLFDRAGQGFEPYVSPDENLAQWRFVDAVGDYAAEAPLDEPDGSADIAWVMQLATFR